MDMKTVVLTFAVMNGIFAGLVYKHAEASGYMKAQRRYERVIASRVANGISGYQRVQEIREKSEYRRGFESCQEQF